MPAVQGRVGRGSLGGRRHRLGVEQLAAGDAGWAAGRAASSAPAAGDHVVPAPAAARRRVQRVRALRRVGRGRRRSVARGRGAQVIHRLGAGLQ